MGNALNTETLSAEPREDLAPPASKPSGRTRDRWIRPTATAGGARRAISEPFGFRLDDTDNTVVCVDLHRVDRPPRAGDRLIGWTTNAAGAIVDEFSYAEVGAAGRTRGPGAGLPLEDVRFVALVVGRYRPE